MRINYYRVLYGQRRQLSVRWPRAHLLDFWPWIEHLVADSLSQLMCKLNKNLEFIVHCNFWDSQLSLWRGECRLNSERGFRPKKWQRLRPDPGKGADRAANKYWPSFQAIVFSSKDNFSFLNIYPFLISPCGTATPIPWLLVLLGKFDIWLPRQGRRLVIFCRFVTHPPRLPALTFAANLGREFFFSQVSFAQGDW